ncbi:MAG: amidohydrolase family protein [Bacteroidales bacterium]|nr:amidohydrolase family protein [Bacteroidales bacterium]
MNKFNSNISKTTKSRLNSSILSLFEQGDFRFDVHVHLFNKDFIPDKYFGIRIPYLVNASFLKQLESILEFVSSDDDKLYNYAYFIDFVSKKSTEDIAEYLINSTPQNTIFCSLMMDFSKGITGKTAKDIFEQLEEYKLVRDKNPSLFLPFVAIDPNNTKHLELFNKAFSKEYNFFGVKIYPSLGFLPSHPNLMKIFEQCARYDIPVVTHSCSGSVHSNKNSFNLKYYDLNQNGELILKNEKKTFFFKRQYEQLFNRPQNWEPVLKAFPNLRINFAHFGGVSEWKNNTSRKAWTYRIIDLMERYPNVYADLSYIMHLPEIHKTFIDLFNNNKLVSERTLFGTDFYMITIEGKYKDIRSQFVTNLGSKIMHKISVENPLNFLNLTNLVPTEIRKKWHTQTL